jgi:hypothetical protein
VVDTDAQWHKGRTEIKKYASKFRQRLFDSGHYESELSKLAMVYPDVAVATTRWNTTSGSGGLSARGMGLIVLRRNTQGWRIVAEQKTISRGEPPKK